LTVGVIYTTVFEYKNRVMFNMPVFDGGDIRADFRNRVEHLLDLTQNVSVGEPVLVFAGRWCSFLDWTKLSGKTKLAVCLLAF
jgi:hypothetical protein